MRLGTCRQTYALRNGIIKYTAKSATAAVKKYYEEIEILGWNWNVTWLMQKPYTTYQLEVLLYANDSTVKANEHLVSHASRMLFGIICNPNVVHFNRRFVLIANDFWILLSSLCTCISRIACLPLLRSRSLRFVSALRSYVRLIRLSVSLSAWARSVSAYKQSIDLWSVTFFFSMRLVEALSRLKLKNLKWFISKPHIKTQHNLSGLEVFITDFTLCFVDTK